MQLGRTAESDSDDDGDGDGGIYKVPRKLVSNSSILSVASNVTVFLCLVSGSGRR